MPASEGLTRPPIGCIRVAVELTVGAGLSLLEGLVIHIAGVVPIMKGLGLGIILADAFIRRDRSENQRCGGYRKYTGDTHAQQSAARRIGIVLAHESSPLH
jgi:uncharacterized membrane protein